MTTRWLVTGADGLLGQDMGKVLMNDPEVEELATFGHKAFDITDTHAVEARVGAYDVVVNTAAWTNVDSAEQYHDEAFKVNGSAVGALAWACEQAGTVLLHVSSNAVFSGDSPTCYTEQSIPGPISTYGRSKCLGEANVRAWAPTCGYVIRTAGLYGAGGRNFISEILTHVRNGATSVPVAYDQWVQPTWSYTLAQRIKVLGHAVRQGAGNHYHRYYHGISSGQVTWYDLAVEAVTLAGLDPKVIAPIPGERYPRVAPQGRYMVLSQERWKDMGMEPMDDWRQMLKAAFDAGIFDQVPA
jgi:dTDP-4-dehydrorhamnose reductase